jgi:hypothetical protein
MGVSEVVKPEIECLICPVLKIPEKAQRERRNLSK